MTRTLLRDLLWSPHAAIAEAVKARLISATSGEADFSFRPEISTLRFKSVLMMRDGEPAEDNPMIGFASIHVIRNDVHVLQSDGLRQIVVPQHPIDLVSHTIWSPEAPKLVRHLWEAAYHAFRAAAVSGELRIVGCPGSENADPIRIKSDALPDDLSVAQREGRIDFEGSVLRLRSGETFYRVSIEAPRVVQKIKLSNVGRFEVALRDRVALTASLGPMTKQQVKEWARREYQVPEGEAFSALKRVRSEQTPEIDAKWGAGRRAKPKA